MNADHKWAEHLSSKLVVPSSLTDNDLKKKLANSITTIAWYHQKSKSCLLRNTYLSGAKQKKKKTKDKEKQGEDADKIENDAVLLPIIMNSLESKRLQILYCTAGAEERFKLLLPLFDTNKQVFFLI